MESSGCWVARVLELLKSKLLEGLLRTI